MSDNEYHYLSPRHQHSDGSIGRDLFTTDRMSTLERDTSRTYDLSMARDIGTKSHLVEGRDY